MMFFFFTFLFIHFSILKYLLLFKDQFKKKHFTHFLRKCVFIHVLADQKQKQTCEPVLPNEGAVDLFKEQCWRDEGDTMWWDALCFEIPGFSPHCQMT